MPDLDGDDVARKAAAWTWTNRQWIVEKLSDIKNWLFGSGQEESASGILIIGPGGVGKSTAARTLAGGYDAKPDIPGEYVDSHHKARFVVG